MKKLNRLKIFYQQHILPIVYDYSMSLSEVVQKLVKVVNNLVDEVGDIEDKTAVYDDKIAALESKAADQAVYNEHINTAIEEINNTISELPTYDVIEDLRTDITNINSSIADLDTRVTVLEGQNIYQRLDTAEQNIANLGNDVDALELDVSNINMEISGINNRIDNLEDCCSDVQGDITNINGEITTINEDMSDMLDDITDLQTAVLGKSTVSFNQIQTTGNKIGEITIDGQTIDIYSPSSSGSSVSVTIPQPGVDSLAVITVDGVDYNITAQNGDNIWVDSLRYPGTREMLSNALSNAYRGLDSAIFDINRKVFFDYQKDPGEYVDYPINQQALSGHLTGSGKSVYIFIPFNKFLVGDDSDYSFTISGDITIRAINGYLRDSASPNTYNFNGIDISSFNPQLYKTELGFRLVLTLPAAASATNNTPITAYFSGNGKIRITVL